nr:DNA-directed RNA polymerase III subunit RPC6-like [Ipomoea batatas]
MPCRLHCSSQSATASALSALASHSLSLLTSSSYCLQSSIVEMKRGRKPDGASPSQPLADSETVVLNLIKGKKNMGIWLADIKREAKLQPAVVDKSLASLVKKNLIKQVKNIQNKARKHYMAVEFEPSEELTGGAWYNEGNLDKELINILKETCLKVINKLQVTTAQGIFDFLKDRKAINCTIGQISEILRSMVLDNAIIEVKSSGLGEYHSIPLGAVCYRIASAATATGPKTVGAMASIPCGVCPRINECTPDGIISPKTCEYYTKWLEF